MSNEEFLKVFEEVKQYVMENYYVKFIECGIFGRNKKIIIKFDTAKKIGIDIWVEASFENFGNIKFEDIMKEYKKNIEFHENKYGMTDLFIRDETKACGCCAKCYRIINVESYKKLSCNENGEVLCWQCRLEKEI